MTTRQLAEAIGQAVDVPTRGFPRAEVETLWGAFLTGFRPRRPAPVHNHEMACHVAGSVGTDLPHFVSVFWPLQEGDKARRETGRHVKGVN